MKLPVAVPREKKELWYGDGLSFGCTQCGNCCTGPPGYVWVSEVEVARFAEHLKLKPEIFVSQYCRSIGGKLSLNENVSPAGLYDCTFLKEVDSNVDGQTIRRRVCTVYSVRPLQCRTWPFWDGLLKSPKNWNAAKAGCPGIDRGRAYTAEQIIALRDATDWPDRPAEASPATVITSTTTAETAE